MARNKVAQQPSEPLGEQERGREAEIVAGCRRGDEHARRLLFELHHRRIFRFLVAQSGDATLAEDLVQDTFVKAFEAIDGFRGEARVGSWLTRIALNCLYESKRRASLLGRVRARVEAGGAPPPAARRPTQRSVRPELHHSQRDLVGKAFRSLGDNDRSVLLMHDMLGHSYEEIAAAMNIAVGTVGSRLYRARRRMREILGTIGEGNHRPAGGGEESRVANRRTSTGDAERDSPRRRVGNAGEEGPALSTAPAAKPAT